MSKMEMNNDLKGKWRCERIWKTYFDARYLLLGWMGKSPMVFFGVMILALSHGDGMEVGMGEAMDLDFLV